MLHAALTVRLPSASPMPIPPPSVTPRWQAAVNDPAMGTPLVGSAAPTELPSVCPPIC